ncbi:hypothetical protein MMPV_009140 [Pyropia vietnamensis]
MPSKLKLYTFERPALADYSVVLLTGEHTHPRAIRAIPRGQLRSRVFEILEREPTTTRAQVARRIQADLHLRPNSSSLAHAYADFRLERNPLGEDQVGVAARLDASQGGPQYVRKTVFDAGGPDGTYSYVVFYRDDMIRYAALQPSFCADLSLKDFDPSTRPAAADGKWHLFSVTTWSERLQRTVTKFLAATIGESEALYRELFGEFLRACALSGQVMPTVGDAVTGRTTETVRQRELVSFALDFCAAHAQGAAFALAVIAGLVLATDAARAFLRGVHKLLLDREGADHELWQLLRDAPATALDEAAVDALLGALAAHAHSAVRNWATWAGRPIIRHMIFSSAYSRLSWELLSFVPASTNIQESSHRANLTHCQPGTQMAIIEQHEKLDAETMGRVLGMGSGGSELSRPATQQRRFTIFHQHATRASSKRARSTESLTAPPPHSLVYETGNSEEDPQGGAGGDGSRPPRQADGSAGDESGAQPGPPSGKTGGTRGADTRGTMRAGSGGLHGGKGSGVASGSKRLARMTSPGSWTPPVLRPDLPPEASLTAALGAPRAVPEASNPAPSDAAEPVEAVSRDDITRLLAVVARQERLLQTLLADKSAAQRSRTEGSASVLSDVASSPKRGAGGGEPPA